VDSGLSGGNEVDKYCLLFRKNCEKCFSKLGQVARTLFRRVTIIFWPHYSTTYVGAAYCYRLNNAWSVCRSVTNSRSCVLQSRWTDRDAVWDV